MTAAFALPVKCLGNGALKAQTNRRPTAKEEEEEEQ